MAKFDMIANHKKGFTNSTLGNTMRGGLFGGALFGGIAAIATIATGGLALPVVLGAAALGAGTLGVANGIGGGLRWTAETIGGIIGINRPQRGGRGEFGDEGQEQPRGMGMMEGIVALVGAAMGLQSMKNKLANWAGVDTPAQGEGQAAAPRSPDFQSPQAVGGNRQPRIPGILQPFMEEGKLQLNKEQLADPMVRDALEDFGEQQAAYRNSLARSNNPADRQTARGLNAKAMEAPEYIRDTETFVINPEHAMDSSLVRGMNDHGVDRQKANIRAAKAEQKALQRESRDISRGRAGEDFAEFGSVDEYKGREQQAAPQQSAPAQPAPQQVAPQQPAREQSPIIPVSREVGSSVGQTPSGLLVANGRTDMSKLMEDAKNIGGKLSDSGVSRVGESQGSSVKSATNTGQARPQQPGQGIG